MVVNPGPERTCVAVGLSRRQAGMTGAEFQTMFKERVAPMLSEMGVSGFVIAGYVEDGDRRCGRFAMCIANTPPVEDGLRQLATFAGMWAAPAMEFAPPAPPDAEKP